MTIYAVLQTDKTKRRKCQRLCVSTNVSVNLLSTLLVHAILDAKLHYDFSFFNNCFFFCDYFHKIDSLTETTPHEILFIRKEIVFLSICIFASVCVRERD